MSENVPVVEEDSSVDPKVMLVLSVPTSVVVVDGSMELGPVGVDVGAAVVCTETQLPFDSAARATWTSICCSAGLESN